MTEMNKPRKNGRAESKPLNWPVVGQKEPLDAVVSDWDRRANQSLDPREFPDGNPKRGRAAREAYEHAGGTA
jgi:hypothetical protein